MDDPRLEIACPACDAFVPGHRCQRCGAAITAGPYRALRLIAESGHGRTYLAEGPEGVVALKELVFAVVPAAEHVEAFEREAELLRTLQHPAIPRFVAAFTEGEGPGLRLYLAQELIDGESLERQMESRRFDEADLRVIAREALAILGWLHARGVVHRDLKPANLIIRPDRSLALVDFGSARAVQGVTHGATLVGTFGYMPPEQLGGTVDATADLYALGATLIHLSSRVPPHELMGRDLAVRTDHLRLSRGMREVLARMVAPRREERFRSAGEALAALDGGRPARRIEARLALAVAAVSVAWIAVAQVASWLPRPVGEGAERQGRQAQAMTAPGPRLPVAKTDALERLMHALIPGKLVAGVDSVVPRCFADAGFELTAMNYAEGELTLRWVLNGVDATCPIDSVRIRALIDGASLPYVGRTLKPGQGWQEVEEHFELADLPRGYVTFELGTERGPVEAWAVSFHHGGWFHAGYAIPGGGTFWDATIMGDAGCERAHQVGVFWLWVEPQPDLTKKLSFRVSAPRAFERVPAARGAPPWLRDGSREVPAWKPVTCDGTELVALTLDGRKHPTRMIASADKSYRTLQVSLPAETQRLRLAAGGSMYRVDLEERKLSFQAGGRQGR